MRQLITLALAIGVCTAGISVSANAQTDPERPLLAQAAPVTAQDRQFAIFAAQGNLAEIQAGTLAMNRSQNANVRNVAQRLVQDHTMANSQLIRIAQTLNMTLPTNTDSAHRALAARLSTLSGTAFDQAYLSSQVRDHNMAISRYQQEVRSGGNPQLKQYASQQIPVLQQHLQLVCSTLSGTCPAGSQALPGETPVSMPATGGQTQHTPQQGGAIRGYW